jgi:hypothetical protein
MQLTNSTIQMFAESPDPAYDDALLLEQHQAPITAAVTPAFSSDSTPEILASAIHACAVFVGCGVVKDVGRMGRSLKLLISALDQSKGMNSLFQGCDQYLFQPLDVGMLSLGDAGEMSPNASAMLRISTLSAWAQLQVSSVQQSYLENVVKPYRSTLCTLWIAGLRDYASIRIDSEFLHDTSSVVDSSYSSLGKEVLLPVSLRYCTALYPALTSPYSIIHSHGLLSCRRWQPPWKRVTLTFWLRWMGLNTMKRSPKISFQPQVLLEKNLPLSSSLCSDSSTKHLQLLLPTHRHHHPPTKRLRFRHCKH